jgi:hypothetical protein
MSDIFLSYARADLPRVRPHHPGQRWSSVTINTLLHRLQCWAWEKTLETSSVALRFGLHVGTVEIITDINGRPNVCGDTLNYAQRIMDDVHFVSCCVGLNPTYSTASPVGRASARLCC